jgi:DNA-binding transcriptional regulator YiaG
MMINQHGSVVVPRVVDQFEATDLGAPFKVILKNCVKVASDAETGELISYTIPDPDGLLRVVTLSRVLHPRKLSGADIRFLRKAVGIKQKDLARAIELSPEHLSKVEAGSLPIGPSSEKLLRIFLAKTAHEMDGCKPNRELETALDQLFDWLTPAAVHDAANELELGFVRRSAAEDNGSDEECWDKLAA